MSKSTKKFLRTEKARIRKQIIGSAKQNEAILDLYKNLSAGKKGEVKVIAKKQKAEKKLTKKVKTKDNKK